MREGTVRYPALRARPAMSARGYFCAACCVFARLQAISRGSRRFRAAPAISAPCALAARNSQTVHKRPGSSSHRLNMYSPPSSVSPLFLLRPFSASWFRPCFGPLPWPWASERFVISRGVNRGLLSYAPGVENLGLQGGVVYRFPPRATDCCWLFCSYRIYTPPGSGDFCEGRKGFSNFRRGFRKRVGGRY